jgi:F-type H+-transporting ATPase subunit a
LHEISKRVNLSKLKKVGIISLFFVAIAFVLFTNVSSTIVDNAPRKQETQVVDPHAGHNHAAGEHEDVPTVGAEDPTEEVDGHGEFDPTATATHHISDANVYSILEAFSIPLPMILYNNEKGFDVFMSSKFHVDVHHHEDGHHAYKGYVLYHGNVHRLIDPSFPSEGEVEIEGFVKRKETAEGKEVDVIYAKYEGKELKAEPRSTWDGGALGGGVTSFYDLSITKNVVAMFLVSLLLFWLFRSVANSYAKNEGRAPKGVTNMMEMLIVFIRDEVAIPFIGLAKYKKYFPLLLTLFFFILGLNLFGQIPFLGSINATGNISLTMVLAILVFVLVSFNGNKHYWQHIFWMPGLPTVMKPLLAIVEIMSMFIKPLTLMLRLAGNITAGHIAIISFIGLIFIFGESGKSLIGGTIGSILSVPLTLFMMSLELIVAFIQAFVFTILTASYIGAAIEVHHSDEHFDGAH